MQCEMNETRYEAALFDLDGVLIDTEGTYSEFWDAMALRHNKPATFANDIKGTTLSRILAENFPAEMHAEIEQQIHDFEDAMEFRLFPGVDEFLHALADSHVPMAIVTSSDDKKILALRRQLPALLDMMQAVVDGSMVTRSKPDPEGYLKAAALLGKDPDRCIVFEDSLQGLEAGRRAGCKVVGLVTTNPPEKVKPLCDVDIDGWEGMTPSFFGFIEL